ncbi:MAG TPA: cell division protein FtsA [Thermodesulfovibrionales bacterium]|nr:cell division protein FtsA [Thermodesulfovibrionales bacterium]
MPARGGTGKTVVGLDVGTTKICAIVGKEEMGKVEIVAVGLSPSAGLRKGVVVDMDLTTGSIVKAIRDASDKAGFPIRSVYVGIAGGHIKGFTGSGAIALKDGIVKEEDVERLMDSAGAVYVPVERDVLHVISAGYRLDGRNGIIDPVGLAGTRLEANVHIVTGSVTSVQNLVTCCTKAGVSILDIVLEPLASAEAVLSKTEKKRGVVLVDIGGGTTDVAFYRDGVLRHTAVLSIGGNHLTNDIAVGLNVPVEEAEKIKKAYGYATVGITDRMEDLPETIEISDGDGKATKVPLQYLAGIIQARCEEFIGLVKKEMEQVSYGIERSTIVLTGGTSLLRGIKDLTEEIFGLPVKIGMPEGVMDRGLVHSPIYATGVGLVRYGLANYAQPALESSAIMERMKKWVSGFLNK